MEEDWLFAKKAARLTVIALLYPPILLLLDIPPIKVLGATAFIATCIVFSIGRNVFEYGIIVLAGIAFARWFGLLYLLLPGIASPPS